MLTLKAGGPGFESLLHGCSGLKENCPHKLTGSGTVKRCDLVGAGVVLLKEVGAVG